MLHGPDGTDYQEWISWTEIARPERIALLHGESRDDLSIALAPVLFGSGTRLFEGVDARRVALEPVRAEPTKRVTHLTYAVRER